MFGYDASRTILNDVSMAFQRGKVTAILGGSGCGKTTLLRLIGGVYPVNSGTVRFEGEAVDRADREQLFALRRRLGMLFQFGALFTDLSVFENVAFPLREHTDLDESDDPRHRADEAQRGGPARRRRASHLGDLRRHGAPRRAGPRDRARSGTDHVRRAVRRPRSDLDGRGGQPDPHAERHDRRDLARRLARRRGVLRDLRLRLPDVVAGQVVAHGTPERAATTPTIREVRQFIRGEPDGPVRFHYPAPRWPRTSAAARALE